MKKIRMLMVISMLISGTFLTAQNWASHCGNNERNGLSKLPGPHAIDTPLWIINNATPTGLGMNVYSFGDLFVTSRVSFSPYKAIIECRNLMTGELEWISPDLGSQAILYAVGFNEDAVYAHDYQSNLFYALNSLDGTIKWVTEFTSYTFGPMDGVIYTCERNIIINGELGSVDESTLCLDKETGEILWSNSNWFAVTPNESKAAHDGHLYMITGAINQPKQLVAVDVQTGENLYYSESLPGDADQEDPIVVSKDGIIYFHRDGGDIFAFKDDGNGFDLLWTYTPINMGLFNMNFGADHQGNMLLLDNGRLYRLNKDTGTPLDSTMLNTLVSGRITIAADSLIYVNNTEGAYYAFSYDLQTILWTIPNLSGNYYSGPSLSREGVMVVSGSGTSIKAYKFEGYHSPVSDFAASDYHINSNDYIDFTDQSSFSPTNWEWQFQGGNPSSSSLQNPQGIYYNEAGIYSVTLITSNQYGSDTLTKECFIKVELNTGFEMTQTRNNIDVFPNPAQGDIFIHSVQPAKIEIINSIGEVVFFDDNPKKERRISVSNYPAGIYIARFSNGGFIGSVKLIVVNNK